MRQVYQKQGGHQQEVIIEEMDQDIQQLKDSRKIQLVDSLLDDDDDDDIDLVVNEQPIPQN